LLVLQQATFAMILTDPNGLVTNFNIAIKPYSEKILSKDESFFLNGGIEKDLSAEEFSFLRDEIKKISKIWKDPKTSSKSKASIWKYLQILLKLSNSVVAL
jgi:hypothetical protein